MKDMHLQSFVPAPGLEPGETEAGLLRAASRSEQEVTLEATMLLRHPHRRPSCRDETAARFSFSDLGTETRGNPKALPFYAASRAERRGTLAAPMLLRPLAVGDVHASLRWLHPERATFPGHRGRWLHLVSPIPVGDGRCSWLTHLEGT